MPPARFDIDAPGYRRGRRPTYVAPDFTKAFASTGQIQTFIAPTAGYYAITADGALGGSGYNGAGGLGAEASGTVYLAAGATLEIVVGGAGGNGKFSGGGGGGGAS